MVDSQAKGYLSQTCKKFRVVAAFLLTFALLGAQTLVLQHEHDGDLTSHVDCSICIQQSSDPGFIPTTFTFSAPNQVAGIVLVGTDSEISISPLVTRTRGPPLV